MITTPDSTRLSFDRPAPDSVANVSYLGHATTLIQLDGLKILTDPILRQRTVLLRRAMRIEDQNRFNAPDVVLISHMHWDHLDLPSLRLLPPSVQVLGPKGSGIVLQRAGLMNVLELGVGEQVTIDNVVFEATPANHDGNRPPFGPDGEAIGFLVRGSSTVYFAGDTDLFDDMAGMGAHLDLALLPVWGWGPTLGPGHMDPQRAATALTRLRPAVAMPIHWGTLCPIGLKWTRPDFLTRPPGEFAQAALQQAPDVNVHVVQPGGALELSANSD